MWIEKNGFLLAMGMLVLTACAPTARVSEEEPEDTPVVSIEERIPEEAPEAVARTTPAQPVKPVPVEAAPTPTPRFDPANPDWPLRYQELYEAFAARFDAPELESDVEVLLEGGREVRGLLLELGEEDILIATASGEMRLGSDMMQPRSQAFFFRDRYAHFFARHQARREYDAWRSAQAESPRPSNDVAVRPRNTQGVDVDPLHGTRRVRRNGEPPVNEAPSGRVRQVEEYILRHAGSPESLRVHYWGRVQPHGDGFTVRVRYSLEGAAGFGLSNEDMIFFMYADGTVYQRAAFRGN
jgi:hypothetical protein